MFLFRARICKTSVLAEICRGAKRHIEYAERWTDHRTSHRVVRVSSVSCVTRSSTCPLGGLSGHLGAHVLFVIFDLEFLGDRHRSLQTNGRPNFFSIRTHAGKPAPGSAKYGTVQSRCLEAIGLGGPCGGIGIASTRISRRVRSYFKASRQWTSHQTTSA